MTTLSNYSILLDIYSQPVYTKVAERVCDTARGLWKGVLELPKRYLKWVKETETKGSPPGYVMWNPDNGVKVTCTEKFIREWEERGFEVLRAEPFSFDFRS